MTVWQVLTASGLWDYAARTFGTTESRTKKNGPVLLCAGVESPSASIETIPISTQVQQQTVIALGESKHGNHKEE